VATGVEDGVGVGVGDDVTDGETVAGVWALVGAVEACTWDGLGGEEPDVEAHPASNDAAIAISPVTVETVAFISPTIHHTRTTLRELGTDPYRSLSVSRVLG